MTHVGRIVLSIGITKAMDMLIMRGGYVCVQGRTARGGGGAVTSLPSTLKGPCSSALLAWK